jgi:predicted nuclease of predicted toxin-antitoxin system
LRFLVDAQLPPALARWLEAHGHSAGHVSEAGLLFATDWAIAAHALAERAIIVTKDEDFLQVAARFGELPQVVWLRVGNASNRSLAAWLERRWVEVEAALLRGERVVEVR